MDKKNLISTILYGLAVVSFFGYLFTKESELMACGGLLMIGGAIAMISAKKKR